MVKTPHARTPVAITKGIDIRQRTLNALSLIGGMDSIVSSNDVVFIKPNLVDGAPFETGEVVNLEVLEPLISEAFRVGAAKVIIGETPTWRKKTPTIRAYERFAKAMGACFMDLSQQAFVEMAVKDPVLFKHVRLSKPLLDADVFINVPTLKTHVQAGITLSIKNMYGLISGRPGHGDKARYHQLDKIEEAIVDLYRAKPADLIVIDGSQSTFHIGPRPLEDFHETFPLNVTLAGFDPVAIDTVGAHILGINPALIRYLQWAAGKGLGTNNMEHIEILGIPITDAYHQDGASAVDFANARMQHTHILDYGACTGCLKLASQAYRYDKTGLPSTITIVMGPNATNSQVSSQPSQGNVVLCGHCAAPTYFNQLKGCYVPGCPPRNEDFVKTLKDLTIQKESRA
jgi:uncharacterized protein (DUF362 family)